MRFILKKKNKKWSNSNRVFTPSVLSKYMSNSKPRTLTFRTTGLLDTRGARLTCKHRDTNKQHLLHLYELTEIPSGLKLLLHLDTLHTNCIWFLFKFYLWVSQDTQERILVLLQVSLLSNYLAFIIHAFIRSHYMAISQSLLTLCDRESQVLLAVNSIWTEQHIKNQNILYPGDHNRCSAMGKGRGSFILAAHHRKAISFGGRGVIII